MNDGPFLRGRFGESKVNAAIKIALDENEYSLLKDVILPDLADTTQIDHVVISKFGIFVVETKNYSGWIFGGEYQKAWKQTHFKKKTSFQNPLWQNYKHTATIVELLGIDQAKVFSIVVFVGEGEFRTPMPDNVTDIAGMVSYIKSKRVELFTGDEVSSILNAFEVIRIEPTVENLNNHIDSLKSKFCKDNSQNDKSGLEVDIEECDKSKQNIIDEIVQNIITDTSQSSASSSKRNVSPDFDKKLSLIKEILSVVKVVQDFFSSNKSGIKPRNAFRKFRYLFYVKTLITVLPAAVICLLLASTIGNKSQPERSDSRTEIDLLKKDFFSKKPPHTDNNINQNIRNMYLIELKSGKTIQADNGRVNGQVVTLMSQNGLEMKINLSQIKSVKKVQL